MDLTPFVDRLRQDLESVAAAVGHDGQAAAARMLQSLEPSVRLVLLEALAQAAAEISAELPAGVVDVRLRGREPELVVDVPSAPQPPAPPSPPTFQAPDPSGAEQGGVEDDASIARITLRLPESLKARAEEMAARSGHSLNAWIVNVLANATSRSAVNVDIDLSSIPFGPGKGRRMTGWV